MKTKILTPLLLLVLFLTISACSSQSTSSPEVAPTEQQAEARSGDPTEEPVATTLPEPRAEPSPGFEAVFEEAPCPMALPAGTVEGEHITCGYVDVPEEHANHSGDTVRLAVAVVHSASDKPAPDPLVMLAGGPGQSALEAYPPLLTLPGLNGFWAERDVVLVEQRGTRHSTPFLECQEVQAFQLETLDQDLNYEERKELHLEALTACRDRLVTEGVNLSAFDSLESAADIVAVLDALGYEEFNIYGGSYGSLLAQHIMRDYPDRVRSAILDAVSPLRHEPNVLYKAHSTDRALRLLFSQCQADPACDEIYPDLESVFLDTVDRLNGEPAAIQIQNPGTGETHPMLLSGDRLLTLTRDLLYRTEVLPNLPQILYDAADGDYTFFELLQAALLFQTGIADGLYKSVVCSELADFSVADMADSADLYPQVVAAVEPLIAEVMLDPCEVWNVEPLDESTKEPVTGDIPTLVLSGEFDPTVPPHLGEVAAEGLTNAYVYSFPGTGHSMIAAGECPVSVMQGFLNDPAQTADESCIDEMAGLVFRIPVEGLELEPFVDTQRGFRGLIPTGWQELQPANLARGSSALDVAYFVLEAQPVTADEMFANLAAQLELDPEMEPVSTAEVGSFAWDFYAFERQGYPADLALAEEDGKTYFVFLLSPADEHESLYDELFLPAVEAMAPLSEAGEPAEVEEPAGSQAQ